MSWVVRHEALEVHADERSAAGHRSGRQKLRAGQTPGRGHGQEQP